MPPRAAFRLAIIADAHFHDPAGDFGGAGIDIGGRLLVLRPWADTETGIRAVNESAAALTAALDRIVALGLRHVVLAGDYSDDGQVETVRRLAALLHLYQNRHGLRFVAIPGNHDVHALHGKHTSARIAAGPGRTALLTSDPAVPDGIVTPAMYCAGQPEGLWPMAAFGLFRQPDHLHWESPFGPDDTPGARMHDVVSADGSVTHRLMDASYLVEPEDGLWLLMLDANVYEPRPGRTDPARKKAFGDPSEAGWNALLRVKPHLLHWIADVAGRAVAQGKVLVTVSHYPVLDPFRGCGGAEALLTPDSTLARRTPGPQVAEALVKAGLRWHAGGHLHVCATNARLIGTGRLTDVALPSLVSFPPAFAVVMATPDGIVTDTVSLQDLPPDPLLTGLYRAQGRSDPPLDYGAFLAAQFRARVLMVRIPRDWPQAVSNWIQGRNVRDLADLLDQSRQQGPPADLPALALTELAADIYMLRDGGTLAAAQMPADRLKLCRRLAARFGDPAADPAASVGAFWQRFLSQVSEAAS